MDWHKTFTTDGETSDGKKVYDILNLPIIYFPIDNIYLKVGQYGLFLKRIGGLRMTSSKALCKL